MDKKALFEEFTKHLLEDDIPSKYFNKDEHKKIFSKIYPFTMLGDLVKTEQNLKHHPEGNVWNHTMLVVDMAAKVKHKSKDPKVFMWAALLHDLGKAHTTRVKNNRIIAYGHDEAGENLAVNFFKEFDLEEDFIYKVSKLVRWHMQCMFVVKKLPFRDVSKMLKETDLDDIALLTYCDRLGRANMSNEKIKQEIQNVDKFVEEMKHINNNIR